MGKPGDTILRYRTHPLVEALVSGVLDLLFPPLCSCCSAPLPDESPALLCPDCNGRVRPLTSPLCPCCGTPMSVDGGAGDRYCADCLQKTPSFDRARSLFLYVPPVSTLLQRLKFQGDRVAAASLVRLGLQQAPFGCPDDRDLIIPVPLHTRRLRERGLNQSLILAAGLFPTEKAKIEPMALVRIQHTVAQTGLNGRERRKNLRGAFSVPGDALLQGKRICLVDDVFTTGTTVLECARVLKRAGAERVEIVTAARSEVLVC